MAITKGHVAGGGSALIIGTGVLGSTVLGNGNSMPSNWTLLVSENDFSSSYNDTTSIGKKIGWYLIGTYGVDKDKSKNNEKWWEWSYKNWKEDSESNVALSTEFANGKVESAYSPKDSQDGNASKALNKVCESVYKKTISDIGSNNSDNTKYTRYKNLLKYCSPLGQIPLSIYTLQEESKYNPSQSYGSNSSKSDFFISVINPANDFFWKLKDQEFFGIDSIEGSGKNVSKDNGSALLHQLYLNKDKPNRGSVKDVCRRLYETDENSTTEKYDTFKNHCNLYIWEYQTSS